MDGATEDKVTPCGWCESPSRHQDPRSPNVLRLLHNTNAAGIPELGEVPALAQDPQPLKVVEVFWEKMHVLTAAAYGSDGGMLIARVIVSDTKKQTTETQFHFSWTSVQDAVGKLVM